MSEAAKIPPLVEQRLNAEGEPGIRYNFHSGQKRAWDSKKPIVAIISGVRGGKTSFGPLWLHREMQNCGPGDYGLFVPIYPLLEKAAGPAMEAFFGRILHLGSSGRYKFEISEAGHHELWPDIPYERPSRILYGHASNPESLAAMQLKAAWCDEPGQKGFQVGSFEEIQRRLSIDRGRMLLTTTIYNLGWIKQRIWDRWEQAKRNHPEIEVINFDSTANPAFPREEWEKARRDLPAWKFDMFFRALPTRPAGLIYDCFSHATHVVPRYKLPDVYPRYGGLDFGAVNTAGIYFAAELGQDRLPTGNYIAYREYPDRKYLPGKYAAETHAVRMLEGEPSTPLFVGGSASEDEWRGKFRAAGLPVAEPPVSAVEVQIDALYRLIAQGRLKVMDDLTGFLDQLATYSRVLDERGEPTDEIDSDHLFHWCAAARYLASHLEQGGGMWQPTRDPDSASMFGSMPKGVFEGQNKKDEPDYPDPDKAGGGNWYDNKFPEW